MSTAPTGSSADILLQKLPVENVQPLWTVMKAMVTARPSPKAEVTLWKYQKLRPLLLEAGRVVPTEQAERRVLMLINPALSTCC
jgi:gentisate 1,2-dioxygenase